MTFVAISLVGILVALGEIRSRTVDNPVNQHLPTGHQVSLFLGSENFVLTAPRTNLISSNKEGIVSVTGPILMLMSVFQSDSCIPIPGYFAIHLLGLSLGTIILPASPSYFRRQQKALHPTRKRRDSNADHPSQGKDLPFSSSRQTAKVATELASYAFIWWSLLGLARLCGIGNDVSRRMVCVRMVTAPMAFSCSIAAKANLPYILWVAAVNTTFILAFLLLDMYFSPSPVTKSKKVTVFCA